MIICYFCDMPNSFMFMKKVFVISLVAVLLSSCATAFQQIASVSSNQISSNPEGKFTYEQDGVVIDYNFWAPNGKFGFLITNNLDTDILVDLSRSFLVVNGMAFDYFQNRSYAAAAVRKDVSSSAFGSSYSSVLSTENSINGKTYSLVPGSSITNVSEVRTTASNSVSTSIQYVEREGIWVPAHSSRYFCEFSLMNAPFRKCGFARNPKKNENISITFSESNTPYTFENMLMLLVGGVEKRVVNSFYISKLTNLREKDTYEEQDFLTCDGTPTGMKRRIDKYSSPGRFYIRYNYTPHDLTTGGDDRAKKTRGLY